MGLTESTPFVFIKVGDHAGEKWEHILERKQREIQEVGLSLWGYGGNLCHPLRQVQPFAQYTVAHYGKVYALMQKITSRANRYVAKATEFSRDGVHWEPIPPGIEVIGSKFALVLGELRPGDLEMQMSRYRVATGPRKGTSATRYLRGRVDKACLEPAVTPAEDQPDWKTVNVDVIAELKPPYAVLVR